MTLPESAFQAQATVTDTDPIAVLTRGADSYAPYLQPSGELHDPVFDVPTQYGTAYHAYVNAVLALHGPEPDRADHADRALRGLDAALRHTADPDLPPTASGFDRDTIGIRSAGNHRDFTWPPILKAFRLARQFAADDIVREFSHRISMVEIERSFRSRPPSNWASVWLSGEWIRFVEGLSPYPKETIDDWIAGFFDLIDLDLGWYEEPGKPNSYDLFTRFHLADLLIEGYDGRERDRLQHLLRTGLQRSLAVQLSDGALASAHRSTGQTWTDGVQIAYFTYAARLLGDEAAHTAADRAMASLARWQRAGGPFSPVHNQLPPTHRVGYEGYTADAHYANLALAFLAAAVQHGYRGNGTEFADRSPQGRAEQAPTHRATAHHGRISAQLNGEPAPAYDGFGLTDLTFGPGRLLHFSSSARHLQSGEFTNLGIGLRAAPDSPLEVVSRRPHELTAPIRYADDTLTMESTVPGYRYVIAVRLADDGAYVTESTPGHPTYKSILVPYLLDAGSGKRTEVTELPDGIRLQLGGEVLAVRTDAAIAAIRILRHGYENRRGLCGLVRIDLRHPTESVNYQICNLR